LYSFKVRYEGEDKICWIPSRRKSFEVFEKLRFIRE